MVTADEIRARVEAADKDRIRARADTAAKIASQIEQRGKVRAELAEIDAAITAGIAESAAIMTLTELSEFTGISMAELAPAPETTTGGRRGRQPRRKTTSARRSRSVTTPDGAPAPVTTSSDY